jgi:hypothetical protein
MPTANAGNAPGSDSVSGLTRLNTPDDPQTDDYPRCSQRAGPNNTLLELVDY